MGGFGTFLVCTWNWDKILQQNCLQRSNKLLRRHHSYILLMSKCELTPILLSPFKLKTAVVLLDNLAVQFIYPHCFHTLGRIRHCESLFNSSAPRSNMSLSCFNVRARYFEPEQYILNGWLDVKSWASKSVSSNSAFGRNSFKKIKNRLHSWCSVFCTLDIKTSSFKYYKIKRCDPDEIPDVSALTPKVTLLINESDVIDISVDKHGKSANFIINVDNCNQLLLSAPSEGLKERWMFTFENMDDIRDDMILASVNSPRKVFANQKYKKSSAPKSFNRLPINRGLSSTEIENEDERRLAELAIACLEDSDREGDDEDDNDEEGEEESRVQLSSEDPSRVRLKSGDAALKGKQDENRDIETKEEGAQHLETQVAAITLSQPPSKYRSQLN